MSFSNALFSFPASIPSNEFLADTVFQNVLPSLCHWMALSANQEASSNYHFENKPDGGFDMNIL